MVRTPRSHCRGSGFNPWWGNEDSTSCEGAAKNTKQNRKREAITILNVYEPNYRILKYTDFPGDAMVKNPPANAEVTGSIPGPGRSNMPRSN